MPTASYGISHLSTIFFEVALINFCHLGTSSHVGILQLVYFIIEKGYTLFTRSI